jgi:two-component system, NarL family, nitrate/nitrite response regulator NarL
MSDPIRVLLADDHPLFREGVAVSLSADPELQVIAQASSGEEAAELARRLRPDVVLLDIAMPKMGGIAAAAQIAADLPGTRIVMLTVFEDQDSLFAALKAGAHGYVLKGVSASELRAITRQVASGEAYITPTLAGELLAEFARPPAPNPVSELTARETEILTLVSQGLTNREIGVRLHLAEKTVKHYMTVVLEKLQVRNRTEAAMVALKRDVTDLPCASARSGGRGPTKRP